MRVLLGVAAAAIAMSGAAIGQTLESSMQGVYTEEQADRGMAAFNRTCAACHGENLNGTPGGPALMGASFMFSFRGKPVSDLLAFMKGAMPPEAPGQLTDRQYVDIIAHILRGNGNPPGEQQLPSDPARLAQIAINEAQ